MNKLLVLIIVGCTVGKTFSQSASEWFPDQAEWYYSKQESNLNDDFFVVSVDGDTTISNRNAKIIRSPIQSNFGDQIFVSVSGEDSVFVFSEPKNEWIILYDFSAQVGDTIETYLDRSGNTMNVRIDSVSFEVINGDTFDVQYFSTDERPDWGNKNIKFLGNEQFLLPQNVLVLPQGPLRCYFPSPGVVYSLVEFACNLVPVEEAREVERYEIKVFPNPARDKLNIPQWPSSNTNVEITLYNSVGVKIFNSDITDSLDISSLPDGLIHGVIVTDHKRRYHFSFLKI